MDMLTGSIILANVYGGNQYGGSAYSATGTNTNSNSGTSSPIGSSTSSNTNTPLANNPTNSNIATQSVGSQTAPTPINSPRPGGISAGLWIAIILTVIALICFFTLIVHFWRRKHQKDQSDYNDFTVG